MSSWARYFLILSWVFIAWVVIDVAFHDWYVAIGDLGFAVGTRLIYTALDWKTATPKKEG